jgi:osmotically-inducible protein OsmY
MSTPTLRLQVKRELLWDPTVDANAIAVAEDGAGAITLRGTVLTQGEKLRAEDTAMRVAGVAIVHNHLDIDALQGERRPDSHLRADVLEALMLNDRVPASVDVAARDGVVTLRGTVLHEHERDEAELVAANVSGVIGLEDEILVDR